MNGELAGTKVHGEHIGQLNAFVQAIRQHRGDERLPATAMFFSEDYPKRGQVLPRALPEQIMAQLEDPASLSRWDQPCYHLIPLLFMLCRLRLCDPRPLPPRSISRAAHPPPDRCSP